MSLQFTDPCAYMSSTSYKYIQLREAIQLEISQSPSRNRETGVEIDILSWMGRVALELIGQGGLGYSFDPLVKTEHNTFGEALKDVLFVLIHITWPY